MSDYDPHPLDRAWRLKRRPWWVCCYAAVDAHWNNRKSHWVIHENEWQDGVRRQWKIVAVKTFKTIEQAWESHSLQRLYAPFNNQNALVCLIYRTPKGISRLTQYKLYGKKDGHS